MLSGKILRNAGLMTLFFFVFFLFTADMNLAQQQQEDDLTKAQRLYQEGDYETSIDLLSKFIEKLKAMVAQKKNVAEAFYLLAKIYFEVGDDAQMEENLRKVFDTYPTFLKEEPNFAFKEKVDKIKAQLKAEKQKAPEPETTEFKPVEQEKPQPEPRQVIQRAKPKKKKKKFPVLLVVGGLALVAILVLVLGKKKDKEEEERFDIRGDWTVNVNWQDQNPRFFINFQGGPNNGNFEDQDGDTGTYSVTGRSVRFEYNDFNITFTGTFESQAVMSGQILVNDVAGTWRGTRGFQTAMPQQPLQGLKIDAQK